MRRNVEEKIENVINPAVSFLGIDKIDKLKDRICDIIIEQIERDMMKSSYYVISPGDIREIADDVLYEITPKIKKKYEKAYMEIVDKTIEFLKNKVNESEIELN